MPVGKADDAVGGLASHIFVMGDDDDGGSRLLVDFSDQCHDLFGVGPIEVAGGFVGE